MYIKVLVVEMAYNRFKACMQAPCKAVQAVQAAIYAIWLCKAVQTRASSCTLKTNILLYTILHKLAFFLRAKACLPFLVFYSRHKNNLLDSFNQYGV